MAAGLSLPIDNIDVFRQKINELSSLTEQDLTPKVRIDVPMPMDYVSKELVQEFAMLAPYGKDNTKPVFADKDISVKRLMIMGKNRNVLKLSLVTANQTPVTGIYFGDIEGFLDYVAAKYGKEQLEAAMKGMPNNILLSLVYFPKINTFRGVDELQFEIQLYK